MSADIYAELSEEFGAVAEATVQLLSEYALFVTEDEAVVATLRAHLRELETNFECALRYLDTDRAQHLLRDAQHLFGKVQMKVNGNAPPSFMQPGGTSPTKTSF